MAPLFWLVLIRRKQLPGRRPYVSIWLAGLVHWLIMLEGIRLAHPALYLGWVALSAYLAVYQVLFVGLTRVAVHRLRLPILLAAPAVWTGLELARGYAITGFSMALLGHTQANWTTLIQIADIFGAYGVSFLVMFGAACLVRMLPADGAEATSVGWRPTWWPLLAFAPVLGIVLAYGLSRRQQNPPNQSSQPVLRVALVQASFDVAFEANPKRDAEIFGRYLELSCEAVADHPDLDLVVWPEGVFRGNLGDVVVEGDIEPPEDVPMSTEDYRARAQQWMVAFRNKTRTVSAILNRNRPGSGDSPHNRIHLLVGTDTRCLGQGELCRYNSALFIDPNGDVLGRYYKMHRVPFGEYILLGDVFPWLYRITPMAQGITPGERPQVFELAGTRMAPSICFESTVPHLIRRQIRQLDSAGSPPDVMVNVTNDGWFWGASILDFHLACAVFRTVEHRLPMLVAANTGFSAHIDVDGRIVEQGPRRAERIIYAEVHPDGRRSWYQRFGDLPAAVCLLFCGALAVVGAVTARSSLKRTKTTE